MVSTSYPWPACFNGIVSPAANLTSSSTNVGADLTDINMMILPNGPEYQVRDILSALDSIFNHPLFINDPLKSPALSSPKNYLTTVIHAISARDMLGP